MYLCEGLLPVDVDDKLPVLHGSFRKEIMTCMSPNRRVAQSNKAGLFFDGGL